MIAIGEVETKDHWEIVIELTNDDSSETKVTVGCRTLDDDWEVVDFQSVGVPRSIGMLLKIPASVAETTLFGLDYAVYWCL